MFSNIGETSQQCNIARQRCKTNVFLRNWLFDSFCQARLGLIVLKIDHRGLCPLSSIKVLGKISGPPKVLNKKDKSTLLSSEPKKWPQNLTITFPMWLIFIIVYIFLQTTLITPESSPSTLLLQLKVLIQVLRADVSDEQHSEGWKATECNRIEIKWPSTFNILF